MVGIVSICVRICVALCFNSWLHRELREAEQSNGATDESVAGIFNRPRPSHSLVAMLKFAVW